MNRLTTIIYYTKNWCFYNRTLINRGKLSIWFDPTTEWPVEQDQHRRWQRVGHEHLARGEHVNAAVDLVQNAGEFRKPRLDRQQAQAQCATREPG